ncbi:uncharacterized protein TRIADDRAFT_58895 [Trichoplax adhaerens]|uniref:MIF4G domain-containing protein n=1 Tax=Trichoplax adhaerens TaxID=10228 RepID=B3S3Z1_TRIAD|nr:hypothetical protein TRIADDRAFT_58895 [Trichoplax adhaerens]EDV22362.1 hypothetical protein TRIADDRAFT_58895 [Trichoplax adhaerens]|eukprot:XP_002114906.1 hypothetical protein TRIADDRAFT_58895 [Trichoplax adhaerens]
MSKEDEIVVELRKIIFKARQNVEMEEIMQPWLQTLKNRSHPADICTAIADSLYDLGVSTEADVIPSVKVAVKIHNSEILKDAFALALLNRCKTDYVNRNKLIEEDQWMQLNINLWFICNMYQNCKNLQTGKTMSVLYVAIVDYLINIMENLQKLDTVRDVLLFALPALKEDEKASKRTPGLTDVFNMARELLKDSSIADDVKAILTDIAEMNNNAESDANDTNPQNHDSKDQETASLYEYLHYSLDELSAFPGDVATVTESIIAELKPWSEDENVISETASLIFNKAVADSNFRYTAALLCKSIHESSVFKDDKFRYHLLKECQKLFQSKEKFEKQVMFGGALFTAEIYLNFKSGNKPLLNLHDALLSYMEVLLLNTDKDYVKCITSLLKLVGSSMDQFEKEEGKDLSLNKIFERLQEIAENTSAQSIKDIISNVVKIRASNWGLAPKPTLNPNAAVFRPTDKKSDNNSASSNETGKKFNPNATEFYPSYKTNPKDSTEQEQPVRDLETWNEYVGDDDDFNAEQIHEQENVFQYFEEEMIDDDMEQEYEKFLANEY